MREAVEFTLSRASRTGSTDELVALLLGYLLCAHEYIITIIGEIRLSALYSRQVFDLLLHEHLDLLGVDTEFLEDEGHNVLRLLHHSFKDMYRFDDLLAVHLGGVHCLLNGFLCFDCKFV